MLIVGVGVSDIVALGVTLIVGVGVTEIVGVGVGLGIIMLDTTLIQAQA